MPQFRLTTLRRRVLSQRVGLFMALGGDVGSWHMAHGGQDCGNDRRAGYSLYGLELFTRCLCLTSDAYIPSLLACVVMGVYVCVFHRYVT